MKALTISEVTRGCSLHFQPTNETIECMLGLVFVGSIKVLFESQINKAARLILTPKVTRGCCSLHSCVLQCANTPNIIRMHGFLHIMPGVIMTTSPSSS